MAAKPIKKYNRILGFDISENSIVVIEIQFIKNNINIINGFQINNPIFQDLNQTIELIKQNLKAFNIKTRECVFGFSMQYCKLFPVSIPTSIPGNEIDSIIIQEGNVEPEKHDASWLPLNNTQRQDPDSVTRQDVLGISIEKTLINFSRLVAQRCNLKLLSVTPSFFGYGTLLESKVDRNLIATLNISQIRSEFVVWSGQEPIYEHLFLTHQLSEQVFQSANFIQAQLPGTQISTILASGAFIKEVNLSQIPYNIQPFTFPSNIFDTRKVLQRINPSEIITAMGLALLASNNFLYTAPNLLNPIKVKTENISGLFKDFVKAQTKGKAIKLPIVAIAKSLDPIFLKFIFASIFIIIFSFFGNFIINSFLTPSVQANQSTFANKLTIAQLHLTKLLNFEKTNKVLNLKTDFLSSLIEKRKPWSKILREIGDMTPKGLWIDRIEIKDSLANIFGRALDVDAVANFSINLNYTAKLLEKTKIVSLRKYQEEGIDLIEYQVSTQLKEDSGKNTEAKEKSITSKTNSNNVNSL